ncbi:MAG: DUF4175 family protein [Bacteroidetes bacterium]|nr:DUF4175 family protein [Bacteroidota bacterium]
MQQLSWLLTRLDAFIRKYYFNQVLRGGLILLSCVLTYFLLVSVSEYYLYLPVWVKLCIVSAFVLLGGGALIGLIILPLMKMAHLGKTLSHEEAARIVGRHFPEVSDKLLNILQLNQAAPGTASRELIEASIDQKAAQISVVPILGAIDLKKNRRYLRFLLPVLLVGLFLFIAAPNIFKEGSSRLLQPATAFERPAPFRFLIDEDSLKATRNSDFNLNIRLEGSALPAELFIETGKERIPARALNNHAFQYQFRNVNQPILFRLFAAGYYSKNYTLEVLQPPLLKALRIQIDYPDYTGRHDEMLTTLGDMNLPVGTRVGYTLLTGFCKEALLQWSSGEKVLLKAQGGGLFSYQHQFLQDTSYTLFLHNTQTPEGPGYHYQVQVIPDQYPVVQVQEFRDTVTGQQIILTGTAGDDYGISRVLFHYEITGPDGKSLGQQSFPLSSGGSTLISFQKYFDLQTLKLQPGQKISYYVEAFDNDAIHGPKSARSATMVYAMLNHQQIDSAISANARQINAGLSSSAQQAKSIQQDLKEASEKILQSSDIEFEQRQQLQELADKQEQLKAKMEAAAKRLEEQEKQSLQKPFSQDLRDKQQEVKKQLDNLLNHELAEQMKKLQELMSKLNKEDAQKTLQQMQEQNKLFSMDMERMKELMKQLETQMRLEELANKADELAQKQENLKQQTDAGKQSNQELSKQQEALQKELKKTLNDDLKALQKLASGLEQKMKLAKPGEQGEKAGEQMQQSQQQLQQGNSSQSSQSQKKAAENLKGMAEALRGMAGGMNIEQIDIDIRATRQLLTNLIRLSFDQEDLMNKVRNTSTASQAFLGNMREQARLHTASQMIRDSLFGLSKRVFKLAPTVNKETGELERNMKLATGSLEQRQVGDALTRQQYVMTHTNNLALMLNELLAHLMQMRSQSMSSGAQGSCTKPGGSSPKPGASKQLSDIITQQQQLGQQMGKQAGQKPGQAQQGEGSKQAGKSGQNGSGGTGQGSGSEGNNEYGDAEKLARLAEQQAQIRRQLEDLQSRLKGSGMGQNKELQEIQKQMDRNETDIVNRRLSAELMMRQQEILTRLLKAEQSLREQEQDNKRASQVGKDLPRPTPPELEQLLQNRQQILESYRSVPPQLKPYYRQMVDTYFRNINTR